jgi:hypothetical protein
MNRAEYIAERHERALENLRKIVDEYTTTRHKTQKYQTMFGDWQSVSDVLQNCAKLFDPYGPEAKRLNELSMCRDSKTNKALNKGAVRDIIHEVFNIISAEFLSAKQVNEQTTRLLPNPKPESSASLSMITVMCRMISLSVLFHSSFK